MSRRLITTLAVLVLLQAALVGLAVAPRLSAHLRGEEYRVRVAPIDPIDPFRGAYVALTYPDLRPGRRDLREMPTGDVYLPLVEQDGFWVAHGVLTERPDHAPYLACESDGWALSCGIESWFAGQDEARHLQTVVGDGAVATIKVDDRGHAAVVGLRAR